MAEVAVAAGGAAAAAAALLGLVGPEHDKNRQPHAQRREQDIKHDQSISPRPVYHSQAPMQIKTRPRRGGKTEIRFRFVLCGD